MTAAKVDQIAGEAGMVRVFGSDPFPVEPGSLIVLAIRVVVAALRASNLVSTKQHRHSERQQQCREKVALLTITQSVDLPIVGLPLYTVIRAVIGVGTVAIVRAVPVIVLVVVADEV